MEYSAQRVRSKARTAVKRREDLIESEEMESGELNLIPYLDMVTNLMLFLLFSVTAGIVLTQIDTTLPNQSQGSSSKPPDVNPDEQPLKLVVTLTKDQMILWSISKLEGELKAPKGSWKASGKLNEPCEGPYNCEFNKCEIATPGSLGVCAEDKDQDGRLVERTTVFPYRKLNDALFEIAKRRYGQNRIRKNDFYSILLQADQSIPYSTIVSVMSAMRCKFPAEGKEPTPCMMPARDPEQLSITKNQTTGIDNENHLFDPDRAIYDPEKMVLFSDIGFSTGFE